MVLLRSWKYRNWSGSDSHICIPSPFQIVSLSKSYLWNQRVGISTNRSRMKSRELCIIMYLNTLSIEQNHIRKKKWKHNTTACPDATLPETNFLAECRWVSVVGWPMQSMRNRDALRTSMSIGSKMIVHSWNIERRISSCTLSVILCYTCARVPCPSHSFLSSTLQHQ